MKTTRLRSCLTLAFTFFFIVLFAEAVNVSNVSVLPQWYNLKGKRGFFISQVLVKGNSDQYLLQIGSDLLGLEDVDYLAPRKKSNFPCKLAVGGELNGNLLLNGNTDSCNCESPGENACPPFLLIRYNNTEVQILLYDQTPADSSFPFTSMESDIVNAKAVWFKNIAYEGEVAANVQACRPATNADEIKGNVAVFLRGNCDVITQLKYAKEAGAIAVLMLKPYGSGSGSVVVGEKILPGGAIQPVPFEPFAAALQRGETVLLSFGPGVGALDPQLESSRPPPGLMFASKRDLSIISSNTDIFLNYPLLWSVGNQTLMAAFTDKISGKRTFSNILISGEYNENAQVVSSLEAAKVNFSQTISTVVNIGRRTILVATEQNVRVVLWDITSFSSFRNISSFPVNGNITFCLYSFLEHKAMHLLFIGNVFRDASDLPELLIVDISEPDRPQVLSKLKESSIFTQPDVVTKKAVVFLYSALVFSPGTRMIALCAGSAGLLVYDLLDPSQPTIIASLYTPIQNSSFSSIKSSCLDNQFVTIKNRTLLCAGHVNSYMYEKNCFALGPNTPFSFQAKTAAFRSKRSSMTQSVLSSSNISIWAPKKITSGTYHSCILYQSGNVRCWGSSNIGYGGQYAISVPISKNIDFYDVNTHAEVVDLHSGAEHTCAITMKSSSGNSPSSELFCWGKGIFGRLGYGNEDSVGDNTAPRQAGPLRFLDAIPLKVVCGYYHTCAIMLNTTSNLKVVRCWGDNTMGQLGYRVRVSLMNATQAKDIAVGGVPKDLALGAFHTCVLLEGDQMKCWGYGKSGQTGYGGQSYSLPGAISLLPTIKFPNNLTQVQSFCAGNSHTCALMEDKQVYCWGSNYRGQLGRSLKIAKVYQPDVPVRITNSSEEVRAVYCGQVYTCVTFKSGKFHCWGDNLQRELGVLFTGTVLDAPDSVQLTPINYRVEQLAPGLVHSCSIISRGTDLSVRCWGNNVGGVKALVPGFPQITNALNGTDTNVLYRSTFVAAYFHTCAIMEPGLVKCWGPATNGALGTNVLEHQGILFPAAGSQNSYIPPGEVVQKLAIGWQSTCVLLYSGRISCWGIDYSGLRAAGLLAVNSSSTSTNYAVDICFAFFGHCVLFKNGSVYCWGFMENRGVSKAYAIRWRDQIQARAIQIVGGQYYMCALFDNGKVACFGVATAGVLGLGSMNFDWILPNETLYVNLGSHKAVKISGGTYHVCALIETGDVMCWGSGYYGQLGYGSSEDVGDDEDPIDVGLVDIGPDPAIDISCGDAHTCIVVQGNTKRSVMCWGFNYYNQLGYPQEKGNVGDNEVPAKLGSLNMTEDFVQVAAGVVHTCALTSVGTVKCWGAGKTGVLGYGDQFDVRDPSTHPDMSLSCGDNIRDANEDCDDGNFRNGDGCSMHCKAEANWHCRDTIGMFSLCTLCGDFRVMDGEECDDGNTSPNDGCSSTCQMESGWNCSYARNTVCLEIHGDGMVVGSEQCDDGNQSGGDGCSAAGSIEPGYVCSYENGSSISVCSGTCGNGLVTASEQCDDGNLNDGDGCSSSCTIEDGAKCYRSCSDPAACRSTCSFDDAHDNSRTPLIVGLAVGTPLLLLLIGLLLMFIIFLRKRRNEINEADLVHIRVLRHTVFGEVYQAKWRESTMVEVKKMKIGHLSRDNVKLFLKEARMMQSLPPHPNLVQFLGVAQSQENFLIVYEFLENGSIEALFHADTNRTITLKNQVELCLGICAGMDHLHNHGVIHRDLAARNILVDVKKSGRDSVMMPKVSDFGLTRAKSSVNALLGRWMAPEVLIQSDVATKAADVWSFGVVIYEIFSRCLKPYKGKSNAEVCQFVLNGGKVDPAEDAPAVINEIMYECLRNKSIWRPSFILLSARFSEVLKDLSTEPETSMSMSMSPGPSTNFESVDDEDYFFVNPSETTV